MKRWCFWTLREAAALLSPFIWWCCLCCCSAHPGQFWHLTDIHYDLNFTHSFGNREKMCWQNEGTPGLRPPEGRFGDYNCDSPWTLVESAVKAMKSITGENIDFILWTGDSTSHAGEEQLSAEKVMNNLRNVTDLLKREFPTSFVHAVLGDLDCFPPHQCPPGPSPLYTEVADMWQQWLPLEAMDSFRKGGYYTIEQTGRRLRLVALNTALYSRENKLSAHIDDPAGQFAWLEEVLDKSRRKKETVYLFGHVPPGAYERYPTGSFQPNFNRRFLNLVSKYSDVIVGQFFGHHHKDSFRIYYDVTGRPVSWMFISPSVSPIGSPRRPEVSPNNPAIRLVRFDNSNGEVLDYSQFYLNLTYANRRNRAHWRVEYNLTQTYMLSNVSAASLHEMAMNIAANKNDLFDRYYLANTVGWDPPEQCGKSCRHLQLCAITRLDYSAFQECMKAVQRLIAAASSAAVETTISSTLMMAAVTSLTVRFFS